MSATVKELAQKLNIKRNSVEMRMNKIPNFRDEYTSRKGNKLIITDEGAKLIRSLNGGARPVKKSVHRTVNDNVNDYQVNALRKMLKQEQDHNRQLQKLLNNSNASNKHLGKLLDQQQQLQLSSQGEVSRLRGQIKHLKAISGPVDKSTMNVRNNSKKAQNVTKKSKTGFWHNFFNKL